MRAFAYLSQGQAGWVEKAPPQATGFDGIIRPLLVSPCTSDVHNVEIGCLAPHRILGHEGLGEIVAVGDQVRDFQVGEIVVVPPVTPDWADRPLPAGRPPALRGADHRAEAVQRRGRPSGRVRPHP